MSNMNDSSSSGIFRSIRRRSAYALRHFSPTWRYVFNLRPTLSYRLDRHSLNTEATRIVKELNRNGIAITSVERLLGISPIYHELVEAASELELECTGQIDSARGDVERGVVGHKSFILQLLGNKPRLNPQSVFARFALQSRVLDIANAYFGMYTHLRYYNVWHTLTTKGPARESQLWHYDREDYLILKLFVYLSEVDRDGGPFTYAPGTHSKGRIRHIPSSFDENGVRRWHDDQMAAAVRPEEWIEATGPIGTMIFADTSGHHKGGLTRERDRILFTCMFTSAASQAAELFERPAQIILPADKAQRLALGCH